MSGSAGPRRVSSREWPLDLDHCWEDRESVEVSTAYGRGTSLEVLGQHHQRLKGYVHVHGNPTSGYEESNGLGWRSGLGCDRLRMRGHPTPGGRNAGWHTRDAQS